MELRIFDFVSERRPRGMDVRQLLLFLLQAMWTTGSDASLQPDVNVSLVCFLCAVSRFNISQVKLLKCRRRNTVDVFDRKVSINCLYINIFFV